MVWINIILFVCVFIIGFIFGVDYIQKKLR